MLLMYFCETKTINHLFLHFNVAKNGNYGGEVQIHNLHTSRIHQAGHLLGLGQQMDEKILLKQIIKKNVALDRTCSRNNFFTKSNSPCSRWQIRSKRHLQFKRFKLHKPPDDKTKTLGALGTLEEEDWQTTGKRMISLSTKILETLQETIFRKKVIGLSPAL